MEKIYRQKKKLRESLLEYKNKYLAVVYSGLIKEKPIKDIHKELYKLTINEKKLNLEFLYKNSIKLLEKINKKIDRENAKSLIFDITGKEEDKPVAIATLFIVWFKRLKGDKIISNGIIEKLDNFEAKEKDKMIKETLQQSRNDLTIFYLASSHDDCAKDHRDYQGRIYIDENWKNYITNREIIDFINKNNFDTFQWVIGKPVYFITRPYCRHYFKQIPTQEVISNSVSNLIKKYSLHRKVGERNGIKTLSHPRSSSWYSEKANIEGIISKYQERLSQHNVLYNTFRCDVLKNMIEKDKILIKKWKKYLFDKF